jgi:hypothetical protein
MSFGPGETAAIPANARQLRIGALLNFNSTPLAVIRLSNAYMWEKSNSELSIDGVFTGFEDLFIIVPQTENLYSSVSQAALLSQHWPPQEVASGHAGASEIQIAAVKFNMEAIRKDGVIFYSLKYPIRLSR